MTINYQFYTKYRMRVFYVWSLWRIWVFSLVRLLVRPWPYRLAPAASESRDAYKCPISCLLCHLMYTHTLMVLKRMSQHSQHQSTARILVQSGPFVLAEQGLLFEHFFLSWNFQSGWERLDSNSVFGNQSAATFCVDTVKYYSIPSVPYRLKGVKTRPDGRHHICAIFAVALR